MIKHGQILCTADTRRKLEDVLLVGFGYSQRFIICASIVFYGAYMLTTCISAINFGLSNYIVNVLNVSVLLACDYERVRDGTLNLSACYDRNLSMPCIIIRNYQDTVLSYVWVNMVQVLIWCMCLC